MRQLKQLDEKSFSDDGKIKDSELCKGLCTVLFYADWCGHCQRAKPIFLKLSKATCCQVKTALFDCVKQEKLKEKLSENTGNGFVISGFPTIVQYYNGKYLRAYEDSSSNESELLKFISGVGTGK